MDGHDGTLLEPQPGSPDREEDLMIDAGKRIVFLAGVALLAAGAAAHAQTQNDFEQCNREAQAAAGGAVTAPGSNSSALPGASVGGSVMTSPGSSEANRQPNASGRISGSAGSPGTNAGAISAGGAGTRNDSAVTSGTISPGSADAGRDSAAYQEAYRDCLKRRGF
jgi:hypothetical protein